MATPADFLLPITTLVWQLSLMRRLTAPTLEQQSRRTQSAFSGRNRLVRPQSQRAFRPLIAVAEAWTVISPDELAGSRACRRHFKSLVSSSERLSAIFVGVLTTMHIEIRERALDDELAGLDIDDVDLRPKRLQCLEARYVKVGRARTFLPYHRHFFP